MRDLGTFLGTVVILSALAYWFYITRNNNRY